MAGYLVEIAKYAEKMGDLSRDIKLLHVMFFGVDGQGGFAKEIERLREWREEMEQEHLKIEIRLNHLER